MQRGQIIRRKLNDGTPVGPYMCITGFTRTYVIAQRITPCSNVKHEEYEESYITRSHVYELGMCKLVVNGEVWERINSERQNSIIHDVCTKWENIMKKETEIIQLSKFNYPQKTMTFTIDQMRYVWYGRDRQIRLDLGTRIL